jgi:hypothetical protein
MKKFLPVLLSLFLSVLCLPAQAQTKPAAAPASKVVQLLEASGQNYSKAGEGVWVVKAKSVNITEFGVMTIYSEGMLILAVTVAEKAEYKASPELMQKLLGLNDTLDRVKIGIDGKDSDIFVRIDLSLRVVDQKEFNDNLTQIIAATDETVTAIKPHLLKAGK